MALTLNSAPAYTESNRNAPGGINWKPKSSDQAELLSVRLNPPLRSKESYQITDKSAQQMLAQFIRRQLESDIPAESQLRDRARPRYEHDKGELPVDSTRKLGFLETTRIGFLSENVTMYYHGTTYPQSWPKCADSDTTFTSTDYVVVAIRVPKKDQLRAKLWYRDATFPPMFYAYEETADEDIFCFGVVIPREGINAIIARHEGGLKPVEQESTIQSELIARWQQEMDDYTKQQVT